jgi:hypothetical protein
MPNLPIYSPVDLQAARVAAAAIERSLADNALSLVSGFASHVTTAAKLAYIKRKRLYAEEIEAGVHDNNFTIWQRMTYHLPGDMVPLLPP